MNRKQLFALLRAQGATFDEKADLPTVEAFVSEKNLEFFAGDKPVDIKAAWSRNVETKRVTVSVSADAGEEVSVSHDSENVVKSDDEMGADGEETKSLGKRRRVTDSRVTGTDAMIHARKGPIFANSDRKKYQAKINSGKSPAEGGAYFADVDEAEYVGAMLRLAHVRKAGNFEYAQKRMDMEIVGKVSNTLVDTTNGYLIPPEYVASIIDLSERYGVVGKLANVVQMTRDVQMQPRLTSDGTWTRATEPISTAMSENNITNDLVELTARYAYYLAYITNSLLEDSAINVVDLYSRAIGRQYWKMLDSDYILGDGNGTYNNNSGLAVALPGAGGTSGAYFQGSGNAWSALTASDIRKMPGLVENVNDWANVCFLCSRQWFHQVAMRLDESANQYRRVASNSASMDANNSLGAKLLDPKADGPHATLLGYDVYFSQVMPTVSASAQKTCYFGDFKSASMLGLRRELNIQTSTDARFIYDQTALRATTRYAVNVHGDGRGSTYGPIVCLLTT